MLPYRGSLLLSKAVELHYSIPQCWAPHFPSQLARWLAHLQLSVNSCMICGVTSLICDVLDAEGCPGPNKLNISGVLHNIALFFFLLPFLLRSTFISSSCHAELSQGLSQFSRKISNNMLTICCDTFFKVGRKSVAKKNKKNY